MESSNETFKHFLEYTGILATLNYMAGKPEGIQKVELRKEIGLSANPAKKVEEILLESNLLTFNDQISRLVLTEKGQAVSELVSASFDILQPKSSGGDGILLENSGIVKMLLFLEGSNGPVKKNAFRKDLGLSPNPIDRNLSLLVSEQLSSQIDDGYQITEKGKQIAQKLTQINLAIAGSKTTNELIEPVPSIRYTTIFTQELWLPIMAKMDTQNFIKYLEHAKPNVIFRLNGQIMMDNHHLSNYYVYYFPHNGIIAATHTLSTLDVNDLVGAYQFWETNTTGFSSFREFAPFYQFDIKSKAELEKAQNFGIYFNLNDSTENISWQKGEMDFYHKAISKGFISKNDAQIGFQLGIKTGKEFEEFKQWVISRASHLQRFDVNSYNAFLQEKEAQVKARDLGFKSLQAYQQAQAIGVLDPNEFQRFQSSGFATKEEYYANLKKIGQIKKKIQATIEKTEPEIEAEWDAQHYEEFYRKVYILTEKQVELIYLSLFKQDMPDDMLEANVDQIFKAQSLSPLKPGDLTEWRRLRNMVIHENEKITPAKAKEAKKFFTGLLNTLRSIDLD